MRWYLAVFLLFSLSSPVPQGRGIPRFARDDSRGNVEADVRGNVEAVVLGIAQDGGVPHLGCRQALCAAARRDRSKRRLVASLGLIDRTAERRFVVDATPDFPEQVDRLGGLPDAILLTHAHIGHYLGLAQLGREVLGAKRVPVYCTPSMGRFLRENGPWKRLVSLENIEIREIQPGAEFELTPSLHATAIRVPHRDEDSDTVAYVLAGPRQKLLWLPDIDKWEKWTEGSRRWSGSRLCSPSSTARSSPRTRLPADRSATSPTRSCRRRSRGSAGKDRLRRRKSSSCT